MTATRKHLVRATITSPCPYEHTTPTHVTVVQRRRAVRSPGTYDYQLHNHSVAELIEVQLASSAYALYIPRKVQ